MVTMYAAIKFQNSNSHQSFNYLTRHYEFYTAPLCQSTYKSNVLLCVMQFVQTLDCLDCVQITVTDRQANIYCTWRTD